MCAASAPALLRDVKAGTSAGWCGMSRRSEKAQGFYADVLKLSGGDFEGKPFELLPWQKVYRRLPVRLAGAGGYRRFRVAYVETAKGSGKSPGRRYRHEGLVATTSHARKFTAPPRKGSNHDPVP